MLSAWSLLPGPGWRRGTAAAFALLLVAAAPLHAQREVFGMGGSSAAEARQRFEAEAREQVSALLVEYESQWGSRDAAGLARLYARNANLYPASSGMLTGRAGIAEYLRHTLPAASPLTTRILEFRASGDLAFATVQVRHQPSVAGGEPALYTEVFVLRRDPVGIWSILSQLSRGEAGPLAAGSGARLGGTPADPIH